MRLMPISHLFDADDAMFIVNVHKSSLYGVGVRNTDVHLKADSFGCLGNNLPFTYLGVKVGDNMIRVNSWIEVPEGILSHLEKLHNKFFLGADPDDRKIT
ncbi:hypothetical protein Tco_1573961, partial [Tanacetum coccineum]